MSIILEVDFIYKDKIASTFLRWNNYRRYELKVKYQHGQIKIIKWW